MCLCLFLVNGCSVLELVLFVVVDMFVMLVVPCLDGGKLNKGFGDEGFIGLGYG
jgi:hypothetical protein